MLGPGAVLGRSFCCCCWSWEGLSNGAGCLPRWGVEGRSKWEARDEVDALDWGRWGERALNAEVVLGRTFCCCWVWEGLGNGADCLPRWGDEGRSKREASDEADALDWGRWGDWALTSGAVLGRAVCCRWRGDGLGNGAARPTRCGDEGASKGSPKEDADAFDVVGRLARVLASGVFSARLTCCVWMGAGLGSGRGCPAGRGGGGGSKWSPAENTDA